MTAASAIDGWPKSAFSTSADQDLWDRVQQSARPRPTGPPDDRRRPLAARGRFPSTALLHQGSAGSFVSAFPTASPGAMFGIMHKGIVRHARAKTLMPAPWVKTQQMVAKGFQRAARCSAVDGCPVVLIAAQQHGLRRTTASDRQAIVPSSREQAPRGSYSRSRPRWISPRITSAPSLRPPIFGCRCEAADVRSCRLQFALPGRQLS